MYEKWADEINKKESSLCEKNTSYKVVCVYGTKKL
jgi:hypothetical protein